MEYVLYTILSVIVIIYPCVLYTYVTQYNENYELVCGNVFENGLGKERCVNVRPKTQRNITLASPCVHRIYLSRFPVSFQPQCLPSVQEKLYLRVGARERRLDARRGVEQLFDRDRRSRRGRFLRVVLLLRRLFARHRFSRPIDGVGIVVLRGGSLDGTRPAQRYLKSFGRVSSLAQDFTCSTTQTYTRKSSAIGRGNRKCMYQNYTLIYLQGFFYFKLNNLRIRNIQNRNVPPSHNRPII